MPMTTAQHSLSDALSGCYAVLRQLLGCKDSPVDYLQESASAHRAMLNEHTAELVSDWVDLLSRPNELHAQLQAVEFGHADQASNYEWRVANASAGLKDTIERFDRTGQPRNAHVALLRKVQTLCFHTEDNPLDPTEQFPGFAMWLLNWQNQKTPKFLQAGALAVMHRVAQIYFEEMTRVASGKPHICSDYQRKEKGTIMNRCMAHTFHYIGNLNWPKGDLPGTYEQGNCSMFFADWDGFKLKDSDRELPPVGCEIVNGCIQVLKSHGLPNALKRCGCTDDTVNIGCGWTDDTVNSAMDHCAFFPSNPSTDPDSYEGTTSLSFHVHFLWNGPYIEGNPKQFDLFGQWIIVSLVNHLLNIEKKEGAQKLSTEQAREAFLTACSAACMDHSPWRAMGALKAKGCSKIASKKGQSVRWQHLNPSSLSGKHALAFKKLIFDSDFESSSMQNMVAATSLGLLTMPSIISASWMKDVGQVPKVTLVQSKQTRIDTMHALELLKQAVLDVTGDAPCECVPELHPSADLKQQLRAWLQSVQRDVPLYQAKSNAGLKRPQPSKELDKALNAVPGQDSGQRVCETPKKAKLGHGGAALTCPRNQTSWSLLKQYDYFLQTGQVIGATAAALDSAAKPLPEGVSPRSVGVRGSAVPLTTEVFSGFTLADMFALNEARFKECNDVMQQDLASCSKANADV